MYKNEFAVFDDLQNGKELVYLDSAASALKPKAVIEEMAEFASKHYSNVHRGAYYLSEMATESFEQARKTIASFINTTDKNIIFTRGATDSINLVAGTFGKTLKAGDEIVLSIAEHHSNIVPWQILREEKGIVLKWIDVDENGLLKWDSFERALTDKTKLVAVTQMSNVLGTFFPVKNIVQKAHAIGAKVLVDGCQGIVHTDVDIQDIGCDFYAFSGHKLYGPTGIGVLYASCDLMNTLPPLQGGGDMVRSVSFEKTVYAESPARFEAGTPAIIEAIGLAKAIDWLKCHSRDHEKVVMKLLKEKLAEIEDIIPLGKLDTKESLVCFNLKNIHPQDLAFILDKQGVAVRVGHHCAQPITEHFGVTGSVRASLGIYNDEKDIERFIEALKKAKDMLL